MTNEEAQPRQEETAAADKKPKSACRASFNRGMIIAGYIGHIFIIFDTAGHAMMVTLHMFGL